MIFSLISLHYFLQKCSKLYQNQASPSSCLSYNSHPLPLPTIHYAVSFHQFQPRTIPPVSAFSPACPKDRCTVSKFSLTEPGRGDSLLQILITSEGSLPVKGDFDPIPLTISDLGVIPLFPQGEIETGARLMRNTLQRAVSHCVNPFHSRCVECKRKVTFFETFFPNIFLLKFIFSMLYLDFI